MVEVPFRISWSISFQSLEVKTSHDHTKLEKRHLTFEFSKEISSLECYRSEGTVIKGHTIGHEHDHNINLLRIAVSVLFILAIISLSNNSYSSLVTIETVVCPYKLE